VDISVRQRLARFRREFLTLDWGGRSRARADGRDDQILSDTLAAYGAIGQNTSVSWQGMPELNGELADTAADWSAAPEVAAAISNLSESIAAEGVALADIAARARREAQEINQAQIRAASRALDLIERSDEGRGEEIRDWGGQDWLDLFAPLQGSVGAIAETALEAGLCAVRAGSSTRGFAQFAREVDELERALRAGWSEIERLIIALEEHGAQAAAAAAELRVTRRAVDAAVGEFANDTIAPHDAAPLVRNRLGRLGAFTSQAAAAARRLADDARRMAELVDTLVEQFLIIVRETPVGDRRSARRLAFHAPCTLATATRSYPARTIDLSLTGALVGVPDALPFQPGQPIRLILQDTPAIMGSIAGISGQGIHISFDLGHSVNAQANAPMRSMLRALQRHDENFILRASGLAREIRSVLERGVSEGSISQEAMHRQEYEFIPETEPPRYYHPAADFLATQIAPFVGGMADRAPDIGYAAIIDRNGFVAILAERRDPHEHVEPGRDGESLHAGMIRQDAQGRRHARNLRPYLAHNLRARDTILRVVSAPIFIGGRHWGCAEIAFRLPEAPDETKESQKIGMLFEQDQGEGSISA
jgi:methyl-accepting chemotaxis protein